MRVCKHKYDSEYHWSECSCGDFINKKPHDFADVDDCTQPHACSACEYASPGNSEHSFSDGHDASCNNCSYTRDVRADHYDENSDYICDADGCYAAVNVPGDDDGVINFPMDENT